MKKIDLSTWSRREIYEHFSRATHPFYSVTIPIDVTNIKKISKAQNISFYHLMIWTVTNALNKVDAFKTRIRNNELFILDEMSPSFTTMRKNEENFFIITMPIESDYKEFNNKAIEITNTQKTLFSDDDSSDEVIYMSCLPWFDFTALTNERTFNVDDTIPRVAWGKYYEENDKIYLHLSLEVNHRTIDGYHIGLFKNELDKEIEKIQ